MKRMEFVSTAVGITLLLSCFKGTGCKTPLELYTHHIKSTTSDPIAE
ncbi:TPA: hypothetical protein TXN44_001876 [Streptococcus suis]|nr:hypothetical protein [Streptococcus suis]